MTSISKAVGKGVINPSRGDVKLIQQLLNKHRPHKPIAEDGVIGAETITAIEEFQRRVVKMGAPDGRVDPGGKTFQALSGQTQPGSAVAGAKIAHALLVGPPVSASAQGAFAEGLAKNGVKSGTAVANATAVLKALKDAGITSKRAQANVLAQVNAECGFMPRSEGNYKAATLYKLYGSEQKKNKVRFETLADAEALVAEGPEAVFDKIYGGRMGNDADGDGYKYRGRGYIQLTGKDNYTRVGNAIGVNLVANPDLANDPGVATKILLNFLGASAATQSNLEDINKVNAKVGPAGDPAARGVFAESIFKSL